MYVTLKRNVVLGSRLLFLFVTTMSLLLHTAFERERPRLVQLRRAAAQQQTNVVFQCGEQRIPVEARYVPYVGQMYSGMAGVVPNRLPLRVLRFFVEAAHVQYARLGSVDEKAFMDVMDALDVLRKRYVGNKALRKKLMRMDAATFANAFLAQRQALLQKWPTALATFERTKAQQRETLLQTTLRAHHVAIYLRRHKLELMTEAIECANRCDNSVMMLLMCLWITSKMTGKTAAETRTYFDVPDNLARNDYSVL